MRIGIDMRGVQAPDEMAAFTRELVRQLLIQATGHQVTLFFHADLGGIDAAWPGFPELRQWQVRGVTRGASDGLLDEAADCDVLLLTGGWDANGAYLPPEQLARGPRLAALLDGQFVDHRAEPCLSAPMRASSQSWLLNRLRRYDFVFATCDAVRDEAISLLALPDEAVVSIEGEAGLAAGQILNALAHLPNRLGRGDGSRRRRAHRPRIAFFSPLPPARSGISDYSVRLLEALERHYAIDLFHDPGYLPQLGATGRNFPCFDYRLFRKFQRVVDYAGIVYQMGNSGFHGFIYDTLLEFPGLVVLHDFCLPDLHYWYSIQPDVDAEFLVREIAREAPALAEEYRGNKADWAAEPGGIIEALHRRGLTFNGRVLAQARALVLHDCRGAQRVRDLHMPGAPSPFVIPHGASVFHTPDEEKAELRRKHGLADDELIVGCFGIVHSIKYPVEVVEAFHALTRSQPQARLLFVGRDVSDGVARAKAEELGLADQVRFLGHVTMDAFLELTAITDIGVNLRRPPTRGETSGALLTLLGSGVATVVTDVDSFSSYPSSVVAKIGPLSPGDGALQTALLKLAEQPEYRRQLGAAAQRHVSEVHPWPRIARLYAAAIHYVQSGEWRLPEETNKATRGTVQLFNAA